MAAAGMTHAAPVAATSVRDTDWRLWLAGRTLRVALCHASVLVASLVRLHRLAHTGTVVFTTQRAVIAGRRYRVQVRSEATHAVLGHCTVQCVARECLRVRSDTRKLVEECVVAIAVVGEEFSTHVTKVQTSNQGEHVRLAVHPSTDERLILSIFRR